MKIKILTTLSEKYYRRTGQYTIRYWKDLIPPSWQFWLHDTPDLPIRFDISKPQKEKNVWIERAREYSKNLPLPVGYMGEWEKFTHKSFAQWETYEEDPSGIMVWLDSDVKIKKPLTDKIILDCLDGKFCAYFDRSKVDTKHPIYLTYYGQYERLTVEGCVYIYNLDHPIAKVFFERLKKTYLNMEIFDYFDWCDTGAFEYTKNQFPQEYFRDINENLPPVASPLTISILDEYLEHWMGTANKKLRADSKGENEKRELQEQGIIK
jgi:hypothetical protein